MVAIKSIVIFLLYGAAVSLISFIWAYRIGREHRLSVFFDNDVEKFAKREQRHHMAASNYLQNQKFPLWSISNPVKDPFCIAIATMRRPKADCVTRTSGYILSRLEQLQRFHYNYSLPIKVFVVNGERPKTNHDHLGGLGNGIDIVHLEDAAEYLDEFSNNQNRNLSNHINSINGGKHLDDGSTPDHVPIPFVMANISSHSTAYAWRRNQILDTALIFDYSEYLGCSYVMLMEDDGIVSREFYTKIKKGLDELNSRTPDGSASSPGYFALKLFYSDTFSGWKAKFPDRLLLISSAGTLAIICAIVIPYVSRLYINKFLSALLLVYLWVFYVRLFLAVGKQSIFPPYQGTKLLKFPRQMAAVVGVVYPRGHFRGLSNYLKEHVRSMDRGIDETFVDHIIDDYGDLIVDLDTYLLLPNVVQHIGRFSSSRAKNQGSIIDMSTSNTFPKQDEEFESPQFSSHFRVPRSIN